MDTVNRTPAVDLKEEITFQDMELNGKDKPLVKGEALTGESDKIRREMAHPNEADVVMGRMIDANGK